MAKESVDYEKQYQEDLERAQALSLESLALEKFKNEKLLKESGAKSTSVVRAYSMNETDASKNDRHQFTSRPRPGCLPGNPLQPLIAPPPISQRRNSAQPESNAPDLISFVSPPANSKANDLQIWNNLQPSQTMTNNQFPTMVPPSHFFHQYPRFVFAPTQKPSPPPNFSQPPRYGFINSFLPNDGQFLQSNSPVPNVSSDQRFRNIDLNLQSIANVSPKVPTVNSVSVGLNHSASASSISSSIASSMSSTISSSVQQQPPLPPKGQLAKPPPNIAIPSHTVTKSPKIVTDSSSNLIDLARPEVDDKNSVRVSILEAFDPLLTASDYGSSRTMSPDCSVDESASMCESVYDEYDPFDYIYSGSGSNSVSDPVYATIASISETSPTPPLPPRVKISTLDRRKAQREQNGEKPYLLFENIRAIDLRRATRDADVSAFYKMVLEVRSQFKYNDPNTNMGLVVSPMMTYQYRDVTTSVEHVTMQLTYDMDAPTTDQVEHVTMQLTYDMDAPTTDQYTLKVWGYNEYLAPTTLLCDYEYVHSCIKLEEDVLLILIPDRMVDKTLARTYQDDKGDIKLEDILPNEPVLPISYDNLKILLETLEKEMMKLEKAAEQIDKIDSPTSLPSLQPSGVIQSVKLVVNLMGNLETIDITEALEALKDSCNQFLPNAIGEVWNDKAVSDIIKSNCAKIRSSIQGLIEMYCNAFRVDFEWIKRDDFCDSKTAITDIQDSILVRVSAVHRPSPDWKFDDFIVHAQIYHGTRPIGKRVVTQPCTPLPSLYPRILMNTWLDIEDVVINSLARESRLVLVLAGRTLITPDGNDKDAPPQYKTEDIGWAAVQFFNYEGMMANGSMLLSIWPKEATNVCGPAPSPGTHPDPNHPVFSVIIAGLPNSYFPPVPPQIMDVPKLDFDSLDAQTQQMLMDVVEKDMLFKIPINDREVLWEKRHYLYNIPEALPKILLAAHRWEWACLPDLHGMLRNWKPMRPVEAIQLLLPTFPDVEVRRYAVMWMNGLTSDELVDFLPQLVVALRHETYEDSPLSAFLLRRALQSLRVAHHLFWLMSHNLPGVTPQECKYDFVDRDDTYIAEVRHYRRLLLNLRALLAVSGIALSNCFMTQQLLNKTLQDIAENVQKSKESQRMKVLQNGLEILNASLDENPTSLPLSPTLQVSGVHARGSSYFQSNTLPLKILFLAKDGSTIPAIYKVGDDLQQDMLVLQMVRLMDKLWLKEGLQQDMLVLQMVRLMDKLWLKEGLDLKMVTFGCVPTGNRRGIIELVTKAETLRKIHVEHGLTGSFKDKPIAECRAVENFTASCAGYCVVTYILGICDRHNDNIMLKTSGHLFHIDFGKFLGDAQMFGNFKRDRAPFVLTSDMAYVINGGDRPSEKFHKFVDLCCQAFNIIRNNGGDRPSEKFHKFVDLCCQAFNIIRNHGNLFLYLFTLMASSGIKGVTAEAVNNLNQSLLPGLSNPEAAANFARLIESSLKSWFTQINFFLHNLAQFKISSEQEGGGELLSFVPKRYTMQTDGRLSHVQVLGYRKRYDPDKYYVYVLRVFRHGQVQHMEVLRTYKEFCEFHQKLCIHFPLANLSR
ncbi:Phosphoinositide 3-kinase family, accessory domain (PIK domain) [Popillia japonica]|uniref:Phosphoinositide 3-kinase family, accessory domain (PIK domain) n=1 Tax=Popillia japonica TaxID=7064 RepID=A0AAW1NMD9_POPJA